MNCSPIRVAVLGSTRGSSLQPVIDEIERGNLNAEIVVVISNKRKSGILERARKHSLPICFLSGFGKEREEFDREVSDVLVRKKPDLILCIGYMRFLSSEFVQNWYGKVVNVHPSLLPKHAGLMDLEVHQAVLDAGDSQTGCTLHFIDEGVDSGPILLQKQILVAAGDTAASLKAKVQPLEGQAFTELIKGWPMKGVPQSEIVRNR